MKITAFSDTHGLHRNIRLPKSDVFIFAGDCMTCGYKEHELRDFLKWYSGQDAPEKIMIAGNHDRFIENNRVQFLDMLKDYPTITYLEDSDTVIGGLFFWGTPHSKHFMNWAFNRSDEEMDKAFSNIDRDVDVLISHAPQFGILDQLENGVSVGEETLSKQFDRLRLIRYHIFGHIHCGYGEHKGKHTSLNVSMVNERYELVNGSVSFNIRCYG